MAEGRLSTKTEQEEETEGGCVWWVVWPGLAEGKEGISPSLHSGREGDEKKKKTRSSCSSCRGTVYWIVPRNEIW